MNTRLFSLVLASVLLSGAGQLFLRAGARVTASDDAGGFALLASYLNLPLVCGITCWGVSTLLWIVILGKAELSSTYAWTSLNYVLVPLVSARLFEESLTRGQLAGMCLILAGVATVVISRTP